MTSTVCRRTAVQVRAWHLFRLEQPFPGSKPLRPTTAARLP